MVNKTARPGAGDTGPRELAQAGACGPREITPAPHSAQQNPARLTDNAAAAISRGKVIRTAMPKLVGRQGVPTRLGWRKSLGAS